MFTWGYIYLIWRPDKAEMIFRNVPMSASFEPKEAACHKTVTICSQKGLKLARQNIKYPQFILSATK